MIDDGCITFSPPADWLVEIDRGNYNFFVTNQRFANIGFMGDSWLTATQNYEHMHQSLLVAGPPRKGWIRSIDDPFHVSGLTGFRVSDRNDDLRMSSEQAIFLVNGVVLFVQAFNLKAAESAAWWSAFETLRVKPTVAEALEQAINQPEVAEQSFDATALDKPRRKRITTWMDHCMVMLRDSEAGEDDNDLTAVEGDRLIEGEGPTALWITSLTEFDVTLAFCVRKDRPRTRVKRLREAERAISVPSGKLNVEVTTGGLMLEIALEPGEYWMLVRDDAPVDVDAQDSGVETIEITLWPA